MTRTNSTKTFPIRCMAHEDCKANVALGVACSNKSVPARQSAVGLLAMMRKGDGREEWHLPCEECAHDGALRSFGGGTDCDMDGVYCWRRWMAERWKCRQCGERGIYSDRALHIVFGRGVPAGEYNRWHRALDLAGTGRTGWCGPLEPDEDYPGYWKRTGPR